MTATKVKFQPGDLSAVGCMVDLCRSCESCRAGLEQYCLSFPTLTYNSDDKYLGRHIFRGYATNMIALPTHSIRANCVAGARDVNRVRLFCPCQILLLLRTEKRGKLCLWKSAN